MTFKMKVFIFILLLFFLGLNTVIGDLCKTEPRADYHDNVIKVEKEQPFFISCETRSTGSDGYNEQNAQINPQSENWIIRHKDAVTGNFTVCSTSDMSTCPMDRGIIFEKYLYLRWVDLFRYLPLFYFI